MTEAQPKDGEGAEALSRWRHVKRGTEYEVLGMGALQSEEPLSDMATVVVYRDATGMLWARNRAEFFDGRFEKLAPPATPVRGGGGEELTVSQSQPCGEASADAEVFAGLAAEPSAALACRDAEVYATGAAGDIARDIRDGFIQPIAKALGREAASPLGGPILTREEPKPVPIGGDGEGSENASLRRALPGAHTKAEPAAEGEP